MSRNAGDGFIGIPELLKIHFEQVAKFEQYAQNKDWVQFHETHYDWWAYPLTSPSSHGAKYQLSDQDVKELKKDENFMQSLNKAIILGCLAWGWDVVNKQKVVKPSRGQKWANWPIRLYKMAKSAQIFGLNKTFNSLRLFARDLIEKGNKFQYGDRDLTDIFLE